MITLADLETAEGLEKWRQAANAAHACKPALRFYTAQQKAGATLRQAIERTPGAETDQGWLLWQLAEFGDRMTPEFRLWLMEQSVTDPGIAMGLWFRGALARTPEERAWLLRQWHSDHTGTVLFPEMERQIEGETR